MLMVGFFHGKENEGSMRGFFLSCFFLWGCFCPLYGQDVEDIASLQQQIDALMSSGDYEKGRALIEKLLASDIGDTQRFKAGLNKSLSFFQESKWEEALKALEALPDISDPNLLDAYKKHKGAIFYKQIYEAYLSFKKNSSQLEVWEQLLSRIQSLVEILEAQDLSSESLKEVWQLYHLVLLEKERIKEKDFDYLKDSLQKSLQHWLQLMLSTEAEKNWNALHSSLQADFIQAVEKSKKLYELSKQESGNLWALFQDLVLEVVEALEKASQASTLSQWRKETGKASYLLGAFSSSLKEDSVLRALKHLLHLSQESSKLSKDYPSHLAYTQGLVDVLKRVLHRSIRSLDPEKDLNEEQEREDFFHLRYRLAALEELQPLWEKLENEADTTLHHPILKEACFHYEFQSSSEVQHFEGLLQLLSSQDLQGVDRALQNLEEKFKLRETFAQEAKLLEKVKEVILNLQEAKRSLENPRVALAFLKGAFINWDEKAYFLFLLKSHSLRTSKFKDGKDSSASWGNIQEEIRQVKGGELLGVWSYLHEQSYLMSQYFQQAPLFPSLDKWVIMQAYEVLKDAEKPSLKDHVQRIAKQQQHSLVFVEKMQGSIYQKVLVALANYIDVLFTRPEDPFPFPSGYTASLSIHSEAKKQAQQAINSLDQGEFSKAKQQETRALDLWRSLLSSSPPPPNEKKPPPPSSPDSQQNLSNPPTGDSSSNGSSSSDSSKESQSQKNMESNQKDSHNDQGKPYSWSKNLLEEIKQMEQEDQAILRKTQKKKLRKGHKPW